MYNVWIYPLLQRDVYPAYPWTSRYPYIQPAQVGGRCEVWTRSGGIQVGEPPQVADISNVEMCRSYCFLLDGFPEKRFLLISFLILEIWIHMDTKTEMVPISSSWIVFWTRTKLAVSHRFARRPSRWRTTGACAMVASPRERMWVPTISELWTRNFGYNNYSSPIINSSNMFKQSKSV